MRQIAEIIRLLNDGVERDPIRIGRINGRETGRTRQFGIQRLNGLARGGCAGGRPSDEGLAILQSARTDTGIVKRLTRFHILIANVGGSIIKGIFQDRLIRNRVDREAGGVNPETGDGFRGGVAVETVTGGVESFGGAVIRDVDDAEIGGFRGGDRLVKGDGHTHGRTGGRLPGCLALVDRNVVGGQNGGSDLGTGKSTAFTGLNHGIDPLQGGGVFLAGHGQCGTCREVTTI